MASFEASRRAGAAQPSLSSPLIDMPDEVLPAQNPRSPDHAQPEEQNVKGLTPQASLITSEASLPSGGSGSGALSAAAPPAVQPVGQHENGQALSGTRIVASAHCQPVCYPYS